MAQLEILRFPDPRLRQKSQPVTEVNEELVQFAEDMLETMYSSKGIGLAAPQVGRNVRLLVIDTRPRDIEGRYEIDELTQLEKQVAFPFVIFNPEIIQKTGKTTFNEGCLSVPGYYEVVERAEQIRVKGLNLKGEAFEFEVDGLFAICLQHEMDHLEGKLFIDRLSPMKSSRLKAKIKKVGYPSPSGDDETEDGQREAL